VAIGYIFPRFDILCQEKSGVARFFLVYDTKTGKNVPNEHKMYQMVINIPNVCKIFQMAIK
jgi:hypothetical protein